ncbi:hypothetical protein Tco_0605456 [Tanacetum coccineum]
MFESVGEHPVNRHFVVVFGEVAYLSDIISYEVNLLSFGNLLLMAGWDGTRISRMMPRQDIPPPTITAVKIPIIRKGEYDIWSMRMRQYICHTDHNLWDAIVNGDLEEEPALTGETSALLAPKTVKQLAANKE